MKGKHIKDEKMKRDKLCQKVFGENYEYTPDAKYHKYSTLKRFHEDNPKYRTFDNKHCTKQNTPSKKTNKMDSYYINATTPWKCKHVKGYWDESALSRDNYIMNGV